MNRPSHGTRGSATPADRARPTDSIGSSVKETNSETSTATATVTPNWKKKRPMMPLMNAIGTNTATIANVVAITARPISSVRLRAAVTWSLPIAQVADDVLAHDDRVVDQEADAQRQRHQRQEVEREAERVERDERRDHRDRQREPGDDRAAPAVQEQEHDQHRQERALDDRLLHAVDALLDLVGRSS